MIVRYLCAEALARQAYPEAAGRTLRRRTLDGLAADHLEPSVSGARLEQWIRTPPEQRQPEAIAYSVRATEPLFALLDAHLASRAFMCGDHFTMADIPVGCEAHRWFGLPPDRIRGPGRMSNT